MGDRALVVFHKNRQSFSPVTYLHWHGAQVGDFLREALPTLRTGDPEYACARFIGYCHGHIDPPLGLGCFDSPEDWAEATSEKFSHGSAGVFLVDVDTFLVQCFNGYGFSDGEMTMQLDAEKASKV